MPPLIRYALAGLQRCWMPASRRYSHKFRFDAQGDANLSIPESDAFYSLNVLLGISRLPPNLAPSAAHIREVYESCCNEAGNPRVRTYMYGMALWAGAELGIAPPGAIVDRVRRFESEPARLRVLKAQDVGMLVSGVVAMARQDGPGWRTLAEQLARHLHRAYYNPETHLFYNQESGPRRYFSSFASQVYSTLGLYHYGEEFGADWALDAARRATARIIELQGPRGEWAWFYYVPGGTIADFYEVYSVHQHGMAPAFLHHGVTHGVPGARDALVRGFGWLFGQNEMAISMLRPKEQMFYRSQLRDGELSFHGMRAVRSIANAALRRSDRVENHGKLILRRECRSYELGWILWSFGGRSDYPELTDRPEFGTPGSASPVEELGRLEPAR